MSNTGMYFDLLFGGAGSGSIVFCKKAGHGFTRVKIVKIGSDGWLNKAIQVAESTEDCYLKFNVFDGEAIAARGRNAIGSRGELNKVVCFAIDVDTKSKNSKYASQDEAIAVLNALPVPPSMIIGSDGPHGGLHVYWLLDTPVVGGDIAIAQAIAKRWYEEINSVINVDSTFSLERILRPVGSKRSASGNTVELLGGTMQKHELWELSLPGWEVVEDHEVSEWDGNETKADRYVRDVLGLDCVERVLEEFGWEDIGSGFWLRPEGTSGSKSGEIFVKEDGRRGITIKTPIVRCRQTGKDTALDRISWYGPGRLWGLLEWGDDWASRDRQIEEGLFGVGSEFTLLGGPTGTGLHILVGPRQRPSTPKQYADARAMAGSHGVFSAIVTQGLTDAEGLRLFRELNPGSQETDQQIRDMIAKTERSEVRGIDVGSNNRRVVSSPTRLATHVMAKGYGWNWDLEEAVELRCWRGDFYRWNGKIFRKCETADFVAEVRDHVEKLHGDIGRDLLAVYHRQLAEWLANNQRGKEPTLRPTPESGVRFVQEVVDVIATKVLVKSEQEPALWMHDPERDTSNLFAFENGLLDYDDLLPHDSRLFKTDLLPFCYDPGARCPMWLKFLGEVFQSDSESIELLQEWFGLMLTQDTSYDKMLWLIGPSRSGKSTIVGIMNAIVGEANTTPIDLQELRAGFAMTDLIGKNLAVVSDARSGSKSDIQEAVVGKLLAITGGDPVRIDRKHKEAWTGCLKAKFVIVANKPLALADSASALASRTLMLVTKQSFIGAEDHRLEERLRTELPGIFLWAKAGLERLRLRGVFTEPRSSQEMKNQTMELSDPVGMFVKQRCELVPFGSDDAVSHHQPEGVAWTDKDKLYRHYRDWCERSGLHARSAAIFYRDLYSSTNGRVRSTRMSTGERRYVVQGIVLHDNTEDFD